MPQPHLQHAPAVETQPYPTHGNHEGPRDLLMGVLLLWSLSLRSIPLLPAGIFSLWGQAPRSIALLPTSGIFSLWSFSLRSFMLLPTSGTLSRWSLALQGFAFPPTGILPKWSQVIVGHHMPHSHDFTRSNCICILSSLLSNILMAHLCLSSRPCMSLPLSESRTLKWAHS